MPTTNGRQLLYYLIAVFALFLVVPAALCRYPTDNSGGPTVAKLAFCGDAALRDASRRLLYVSTLDGAVTALDLTDAGRQRWSLQTGPSTMLSSSIHRFELTNDGRMVRMIPSLYGGLYKFDGEAIEQIPVTADHLLSSSYKFSEDLVISGGKETRSYGVSVRTGRIVYECSMAGCRNHTELEANAAGDESQPQTAQEQQRHGPRREEAAEHDALADDIVVVRRETQTVRAVEPRTGGERWNFSVGHHELELLKPHDCRQTRLDPQVGSADDDSNAVHESQRLDGDLELRVLVPDGLVCAVRRADPSVVVWRHQFSHPIVNAWRVNGIDEMVPVNLFSFQSFAVRSPSRGDGADNPGVDNDDDGDADEAETQRRASAVHPSVYVGMYQRQLYIQESDNLKRALQANQLDAINHNYLTIPWKPQYALAAIEGAGGDGDIDDSSSSTAVSSSVIDVYDDRATALSILYATEYVNGNGFFLYSSADLLRTSLCDKRNNTRDDANDDDERTADDNDPYDFPFDDDDTPTKIIIVSLWFWWKEIMVISLTTALILNVVLSRRLSSLGPREIVIVERHIEVPVPMPMTGVIAAASVPSSAILAIDDDAVDAAVRRQRTRTDSQESNGGGGDATSAPPPPPTFVSRYQTDFEMVQCLGKGGFGVVFESMNKLDDCRYAIKRIQLPMRQESRDRVMREVKTLAHCEHQNIVRYFQAWVETPPPGWQEHEDRIWMDREALSHSVDIDSPTMDDDEDESRSMLTSASSARRTTPTAASMSQVVFSKVINRKERGLDAWITDLNTNECLNFDDYNRKTSFVRDDITDKTDEGFTNDDDDDDFIQFRDDNDDSTEQEGDNSQSTDDTVDIVFTDETKSSAKTTKKLWQRSVDRSLTNDSFQIVFQNPTSMTNDSRPQWTDDTSTTNGQSSTNGTSDNDDDDNHNTDDDDDSFRIEFKHSVNGSSIGGDFIDGPVLESRASHFKKRTISESIPSSSAAANGAVGDVFRKTHRRPLSLDLTSAVAAAECRRKCDANVNTNRMYLYIQMQLCKKQSLKDWLRLNDLSARQRDICSIFRQIVEGVEYCHLKGLIHRDLKPGNIFFALDGQIKIGDFGLVTGMSADMPATPCDDESARGHRARVGLTLHTQQVGTQLYMSPEQLNGEQYCYKVDVFSLGLIFFELLRVFGTEMERIETMKALRLGKFPQDFIVAYPDEYNLLKLMLSHLPNERPTTIGIRARPPLGSTAAADAANVEWHFELPPRRRDSHISGQSLNGSDSRSGSASTAIESRHKKKSA